LVAYWLIGCGVIAIARFEIKFGEAVLFPAMDGTLAQLIKGAVVGLLVTHGSYVTDFLDTSAARRIRFILPLIVRFRNATRGYLAKIIDREERKLSYTYLNDEYQVAIARLYEHHSVDIAHSEAEKRKNEVERERLIGILYARNASIQFKFLLRFLGAEECVAKVELIKKNPELVLPSWEVAAGERRTRRQRRREERPSTAERRKNPYGRRKTDSPYVRTFIVDGFPAET
jgi:hypothetical protein